MGKSLAFGCLMVAVVLLCTATSRGDVASALTRPQLAPSNDAEPEPITGTPAVSAPGDAVERKDPFAPYSVGPPGTRTWSYKQLTAAERAWADRNADTTGWEEIHDEYAAAVRERAQQAALDAAAHQLGIVDGHLATLGVVP